MRNGVIVLKILASDYDGTLRQNDIVSENDINAINEWRKNGNLFGLVTGRHLISIKEEIQKYSIPVDFVICATGAIITDSKFNVLFSQSADPECIKALYSLTKKMHGLYFCLSDFEKRTFYKTGKSTHFRNYKLIEFDGDFLTSGFHEMGTRFNHEYQAKRFETVVRKKLGNYLNPQQNGECVDVSAKYISKTTSLYRLLDIMNTDKRDLIVAGDNHNDIEMVCEFDGFAMSSGKRKLKRLAAHSADNICEIINMTLSNAYVNDKISVDRNGEWK